MDPNELLERLLAMATEAQALSPYIPDDRERAMNLADDLGSAFVDLHEWLAKGGFLPAAWARGGTQEPGMPQGVYREGLDT